MTFSLLLEPKGHPHIISCLPEPHSEEEHTKFVKHHLQFNPDLVQIIIENGEVKIVPSV
jgi:hypothetical protein